MKYAKHIVFFLFINLIIILLTIFLGNLTRKIEINNDLTKQYIDKQKEQLKVNKIEYSFYNNSNYLKKLHQIYFSYEEKDLEKKIVNLSNISNHKNNIITLINYKSK
jgi:hypothetical protein